MMSSSFAPAPEAPPPRDLGFAPSALPLSPPPLLALPACPSDAEQPFITAPSAPLARGGVRASQPSLRVSALAGGSTSCGSLAGALGRGGGDALQRVPSSGGMRKSVSFNALRRVVLVPSAKEMSQEAIRQKWCVSERVVVGQIVWV